MAADATVQKHKQNVNRSRLGLALVPLALSLLAAGFAYYYFFQRNLDTTTYYIASDQPGSDMNQLLGAVAAITSANSDRYKFEIYENDEDGANAELLDSATVDFAPIPADAISRSNFAMIADLVPDTYHLIARADSDIRTIHDIVGKRIAVPPANSSAYRSFWMLVSQYGLSPERFRNVPMIRKTAIQALRQAQVDAIFVMLPPGDRQIVWLADALKIRLIPIDQAQAMSLKYTTLTPYLVPKGTYNGNPPTPARDIESVATRQMLVTRTDVPDDVARLITTTLFENRRELTLQSRLAGFVTQPDLNGGTLLPVHPGALAYFDRDQPSFFQQNAEPIGVVVSLVAILFSIGLWIKRRWEEGQKGRVDTYNLDLIAMTEKARTATSLAEISALKSQLFDMLAEVVRDLDEDRIDGQGFHYFAFTWEAVLAAISEQENRLGTGPEVTASQRENLKKFKQRRAS